VIVLLAYTDPRQANCRVLLEQSEREDLAAQVNAAILGYPRPWLYDAVNEAALQALLPGPKRSEKQVMEAVAGRSLADILARVLDSC
jgi:hypothetical protein